jgi:predicted transposase YdaD
MAKKPRIREIIRQFPQNGIKLLLEDRHNTEDLLHLTGSDLVELIDCRRLELVRTSFVARDYRNVEADLVLRAPVRSRRRGLKHIWIYILIEHQSEPDELMLLRLLDYVVQILKYQVREWQRRHGSRRRVRLQPVLPLVFYTGTKQWESVGRLKDLMELGERFAPVTPHLEPLYLNLGAISAERLKSAGGSFGQVLRLVQRRKALPEEFRTLLAEVLRNLEAMPARQRLRWLELLSYLRALVYHERSDEEQAPLGEAIEAAVRTAQQREGVLDMFRSGADVLKEQGRKEGRKKGRDEGRREGELHGRRQALLLQLRTRFKDLPLEMVTRVEQTKDIEQLDTWLERFATATTLADIGIMAGR